MMAHIASLTLPDAKLSCPLRVEQHACQIRRLTQCPQRTVCIQPSIQNVSQSRKLNHECQGINGIEDRPLRQNVIADCFGNGAALQLYSDCVHLTSASCNSSSCSGGLSCRHSAVSAQIAAPLRCLVFSYRASASCIAVAVPRVCSSGGRMPLAMAAAAGAEPSDGCPAAVSVTGQPSAARLSTGPCDRFTPRLAAAGCAADGRPDCGCFAAVSLQGDRPQCQ